MSKLDIEYALAVKATKLIKLTKEEHYKKNTKNNHGFTREEEAINADWMNQDARCHQFGVKDKSNKKYTSEDGKLEAVFDKKGNIVNTPENMGTYNFKNAEIYGPIAHYMYDIAPWILWGNTKNDKTSWKDRVKAFKKW